MPEQVIRRAKTVLAELENQTGGKEKAQTAYTYNGELQMPLEALAAMEAAEKLKKNRSEHTDSHRMYESLV